VSLVNSSIIPVITCEPGTYPGCTLAPITKPFLSQLKALGFNLFVNKYLSSIFYYLFVNPLLELIVTN
jgi:hypothetical protein